MPVTSHRELLKELQGDHNFYLAILITAGPIRTGFLIELIISLVSGCCWSRKIRSKIILYPAPVRITWRAKIIIQIIQNEK